MRFSTKRTFLVSLLLGVVLVIGLNLLSSVSKTNLSPTILIDQFGYRPQDQKVAVIRRDGSSSGKSSTEQFKVVNIKTGAIALSPKAIPWDQGKVHSQSGDIASLLDFSSVKQPGQYIIQSQSGEKSFPFEIADNIYRKALVAAMRMYFYQRSGFAKLPPYADTRWQDGAAFLGQNQDTEARFIGDQSNALLARDLRGGWFDAGDTNKYVTFAANPVHQLLDAYAQNPTIWTDDFKIPESGNGIPDVIDELQFELDWLQRMQEADGGVLIKLGTTNINYAERPSLDRRPRFYAPKCSSSTIAAASMFAHGAWVFRQFPTLISYADNLSQKATRAFQWFESHPIQTNCDTQAVQAGDADKKPQEQIGDAVTAAVYLFALTNDAKYTNYIQTHLLQAQPFVDDVWSRYQPHQGDALLFYTQLPQAQAALKSTIIDRFKLIIRNNPNAYGDGRRLDPYGAYMPDEQYHWGSNFVKANYGSTNYDVELYQIDVERGHLYQTRALNALHYLHGVNPLGIVYLTNMSADGATYSANEMWHEWFGKGIYRNALTSPNGPAPGYLTGVPNKSYTGSAPLRQLPPMKAYLDSSDSKLKMWEITEPSLGYQSAYVKLLSKFVSR